MSLRALGRRPWAIRGEGDRVGDFMVKAIGGARGDKGRGGFVRHAAQASILPRRFP